MITALVVPKNAYHYLLHIPDMVEHLIHHSHDNSRGHHPAEHESHDKNLPFNHDHSSDKQFSQGFLMFQPNYPVHIAKPYYVHFGYIVKITFHTSGFIREVWLPPKIG